MTEQEYLRNIAIINNAPTIPELPTLSPEEQAELENFGKFDDEISRTIERKNRETLQSIIELTGRDLFTTQTDEIKESVDLKKLLDSKFDMAVAKQELIKKLADELTVNGRPVTWIPESVINQYHYDATSKSFVKTDDNLKKLTDLQNAYNNKLTNEEVAKHYNSWGNASQHSQHYGAGLANQYPDPNFHVELVADELETTWSKFKKWIKSLF